MRLEKISENQFRCILTGEDLAQRQLQLTELAYGSDKARNLFAELMQEAAAKLGFSLDGYPLMVEAIPTPGNGLTLLFSKVDNPEELDARYSFFSAHVTGMRSPQPSNLSDLFAHVMESSRQGQTRAVPMPVMTEEAIRKELMLHRLYRFSTMDGAARAASMVDADLPAVSFLYQDPASGDYWLYLDMDDEEAVSRCQPMLATLSEYGEENACLFGRRQHASEHYRFLAGPDALQVLSSLRT